MPENTRTRMLLPNLENVLVQEFRLVQSLIDITREERNFLPTSNAEDLMGLVEKKENVLDQMSLLEERRRTLLIDLARDMGLSLEFYISRRHPPLVRSNYCRQIKPSQ